MTSTITRTAAAHRDEHRIDTPARIGGPVRVAWREGTLTRAKELESLCEWLGHEHRGGGHEPLFQAVAVHLRAARDAAEYRRRWSRKAISGSLIERAASNLDAAEANLLQLAPAEFLLGQMPSLLNQVERHLPPTDPRRREIDRIAREIGIGPGDRAASQGGAAIRLEEQKKIISDSRIKIVSAVRGAGSAALREQLRVRSFGNVLVVTAIVMSLLALGVALVGLFAPTLIPLCFQPERGAQTLVVCPTAQSAPLPVTPDGGTPGLDVDDAVRGTVARQDLLLVELIGLTASAVAAASAIRGIRGSSEPHGLPITLAVLKLPTGAITAFLGLLLMRGQFVPGLSALDTSAQILAWALVFGYAQQLFTRFVDQQAHVVLDSVRAGNKPRNGADTARRGA